MSKSLFNILKKTALQRLVYADKTKPLKKAFIIGHNELSKGAYSEHLDTTEWDLYKSLEKKLKSIGDVYYHNGNIGGYTARCIDISNRISDDYDVVFALHFNMFNGVANGCEAFHWHSNTKGKDYARQFVDGYCDKTGTKSRGVKSYSKKTERGAGEVFYPKMTAVLLEPFFGDNIDDCNKWNPDIFIEVLKSIN